MAKNVIKLTEGELKKIITESVKKVISELDWKTYDSAMRKAAQRGEWDRAGKFGGASRSAFNRDFGTKNSVYDYNYSRDHVPYEPDYKFNYKLDDWEPNGTRSNSGYYIDSIEAHSDDGPDSLRRITQGSREINHRRDMKGKYSTNMRDIDRPDDIDYDNDGNVWADDYSRAEAVAAARKGGRETRDYLKGNYQYTKGRGWHLKDK